MKLSLKMIAERLEQKTVVLKFKDIYSTLRLEKPLFLNDETVLAADTLYIASPDDLDRITQYHNGCALVIPGSEETDIRNCPAVIITDKTLDTLQLYDEIGEIFQTFLDWEEALKNASAPDHPGNALFDLLHASEPLFQNPVLLCNSEGPLLKIETAARQQETDDTETQKLLTALSSDRRLTTEREVFLFMQKTSSQKALIRNLFAGDAVIYHLMVIGTDRDLRETDFQFLEFLAEYAETVLRREYGIYSRDTSTLSELFGAMLSGAQWDKAVLSSELNRIRWTEEEEYAVLFCDASPSDFRTYPEILAFVHDGKTLMIANISRSPEILTELDRIFRDRGFFAGISNPFTGLSRLKRFYGQAHTAFLLCSEQKECGSLSFSDCVLTCLIDSAFREYEPEDLLSPVYLRLKDHDRQNRTEYLKTLEEYLLHNGNAVQTAAALFTHRATIIYRIKRICEIGHTDLKKPDELLHLTLSFRIDRLIKNRS